MKWNPHAKGLDMVIRTQTVGAKAEIVPDVRSPLVFQGSVEVRSATLAAFVVIVWLASQQTAVAQGRELRARSDGMRTIAVEGNASVEMVPDVAQLTVGSETRGSTAREALASNNDAMNALIEVLKLQGVVHGDVKTVSLTLSPIYDRLTNESRSGNADAPPPKIIGYQINNEVNITIHDVKKLGVMLDSIVKVGVNKIDRLSFQVNDPKAAYRELRMKAIADARAKADELAAEAGMTLGLPIGIEVDDSPSSGYADTRSNALPLPRYEKPVPIAVGTVALRVSVGVLYELQPVK
jgi:uncharacterized protein